MGPKNLRDLRVIVVGAGFAGLTAAIECRLRGMHSILVESHPTSRDYGDILDFSPNGGMHFERWADGKVVRKLMEVCLNDTDTLDYYKYDGTLLFSEPFLLKPEDYYRLLAGHRGEMHQIICDYAEEIGVEMRFGQKVVQYLDSDEKLGVLVASGEEILGDVVVAADGPKSLAREQVLGLPESKVNSGYAIYRAYYNLTDEHRENPLMAPFCRKSPNVARLWVGSHLHMFVYSWKEGKDIGWVFTHKDDEDIGESWSYPGNITDALAYLDAAHFEPTCKEIVRQTPPEKLVDYKLVWRDPLKTWLSPSFRSCVIGDAAHCHLPTSAQGACQAVEDGVVLAVCLDKAGGDVPLALRVFERVRFNRSHVIHMSSVSVRDDYHFLDFESELFRENPGIVSVPRQAWVLDFDARKDAEENFERLAGDVRSGKEGTLEELALPAGGDFELENRDYYGPQKASL
ncbi:FAD binding domain containing protein [Lasiodiplodia theobromae]|uniref:FAD binding domain containing protein n=1 Tax=Lasiodiplodia theobromae TaxID=45133 RepID=UPI0015C38137|nr:FAD binding domain containing protein [Lasiodiplodia theobromae]KAF4539591.1 FAD binding domain containing protein [Lasiodiplodia theobromae]